jgi:hypothetical protein
MFPSLSLPVSFALSPCIYMQVFVAVAVSLLYVFLTLSMTLWSARFEWTLNAEEDGDGQLISLSRALAVPRSHLLPSLSRARVRVLSLSLIKQVHMDSAGHVDVENFGLNLREHFLPESMKPGGYQ